MMEFMCPLAVEKKTKRQHSSSTTSSSVARSLSHSASQPASQPAITSPPEHSIIRNNIHIHQSFERIMHPDGWCTYARSRVPGERAPSHCQDRAAQRSYRSTPLHKWINSKNSTNQTNHTNDKPTQPRSTRAPSKWQSQRKVVLQTTSISTHRILMPERSAIESMIQ